MKRIVGLAVVLALVGCGKMETETSKVRVEFRLAETEAAEGLERAPLPVTGEDVFLHADPVVSNADIASACVVTHGGGPAVEVTMTATARERFARATEEHVMKRMAILVDGRLVAAPIIRAAIPGGKAIIHGSFDEKEAQRIAKGITQ
jgi:preprotein translocase subunit SecD